MKDSDLDRLIEQDHHASTAFCNGDPGPKLALYSRADYVTLANPLGPPALGWEQVRAAAEAASSVLRDGEPTRFERPGEIMVGAPSPTPEVSPSGTRGAVPGALICAFISRSPWSGVIDPSAMYAAISRRVRSREPDTDSVTTPLMRVVAITSTSTALTTKTPKC